MSSSVVYRLLPTASIAAHAASYGASLLVMWGIQGKQMSWSGVQSMHVVLLVLTLFLVWRSVLWCCRDQPFAYKWMIYILPLLGLELLQMGWRWLYWQWQLRSGTDKTEPEQAWSAAYYASNGCVPLMVVILAHLSAERSGMSKHVSVFETLCVVVQICITIGTLSSGLVQVSLGTHFNLLGSAMFSALRLAYLGKLIRQSYVSQAQLFGLGAEKMLDPIS